MHFEHARNAKFIRLNANICDSSRNESHGEQAPVVGIVRRVATGVHARFSSAKEILFRIFGPVAAGVHAVAAPSSTTTVAAPSSTTAVAAARIH